MNNIVLVDEILYVNFLLCGLAWNLSLSFLVGSYQDAFSKSVQQFVFIGKMLFGLLSLMPFSCGAQHKGWVF